MDRGRITDGGCNIPNLPMMMDFRLGGIYRCRNGWTVMITGIAYNGSGMTITLASGLCFHIHASGRGLFSHTDVDLVAELPHLNRYDLVRLEAAHKILRSIE